MLFMTKQQLLETVQNLPNTFDLEDLFKHLLLIKRIDGGIRQSDNGETLLETEARRHLSRWRKTL